MSKEWEKAGREPSIAELLSDTIAGLLRRRDGISEDDVWNALAEARELRVGRRDAA